MVTAYVRIEASSEESVDDAVKRLEKKVAVKRRSKNHGTDKSVCVCEIDEDKAPVDLQNAVEEATGRISAQVILYDGFAINQPGLVVPMPGLEDDEAALKCLEEIAPTLQHPLLGKTFERILSEKDA